MECMCVSGLGEGEEKKQRNVCEWLVGEGERPDMLPIWFHIPFLTSVSRQGESIVAVDRMKKSERLQPL